MLFLIEKLQVCLILYRLDIARKIIEKAAYITLYASETGSYPLQFDNSEDVPSPIELRIPVFEINRVTQYPDELEVNTEGLLDTQPRTDDVDDNESKNKIFNSNESFVYKSSSDESIWSSTIDSGDRFHNNKFGLNQLEMEDKTVVDINSSVKKPPATIAVNPPDIIPRKLDGKNDNEKKNQN